MKRLFLRSVALASAIFCGSALAADLPSRKAPPYMPPPPPPPLWTGFYVGLNAGGTWSESNRVDILTYPIQPGIGPIFMSSLATGPVPVSNNGGFIGGGQVGYNWQFATNFVAGIEADIQGIAQSGGSGSATTGGILNLGTITFNDQQVQANLIAGSTALVKKSVDYIGTVRGRLGYLITPTLLAYGTAGLAYGGVNASTSILQPQIFAFGPVVFPAISGYGSSSFSDTRVGWTAGGGLEWLFWPNWSAKLEYLYYDLGNVTHSTAISFLPPVIAPSYAISQSTTRFNGHIVRAGVNYHFHWGAPVVAKY